MARIRIVTGEGVALRLEKLGNGSEEIAKKAVYAAAQIVANEMRRGIHSIPTEKFRRLKPGETFAGISRSQKQDLLNGFGVTGIRKDRNGTYNAHIGFHGYGRFPTKKYPKGVPNPLLARSIESGSSVRAPFPFVRRAVNAMKARAVQAMEEAIASETAKIMETGG